MGNAEMYGIEKGDVIVSVNGRTPHTGNDLIEAAAQTNRSNLSLGVMSKAREYFEFEFPIPFRRPEVMFVIETAVIEILVQLLQDAC